MCSYGEVTVTGENVQYVVTATVDLWSKEWGWIECGWSPSEAEVRPLSSVTKRRRSRAGDPLA